MELSRGKWRSGAIETTEIGRLIDGAHGTFFKFYRLQRCGFAREGYVCSKVESESAVFREYLA